MRGMIKWKPFNTILKDKDIEEIIESKNLINKPILMIDKINYINETLKTAINDNLNVIITYWSHNTLKKIEGKISKINELDKYLLINKTRIYFKNLINIIL